MLSPSYVQILCSADVDAHPGLQALQMHGLIYTRPRHIHKAVVRILSGKGILLSRCKDEEAVTWAGHSAVQFLGSLAGALWTISR